MEDRDFVVFVEWDYCCENPYEECVIRPATEEDKEYDGWNFITGAGRDGASIDVYHNLLDAIVHSHFNPFAIEYTDLTDEETKVKDEYLELATWSYEEGLKIKKE